MIALTIKQPWASLIIHHGKDIENRSWPTNVRGRVAIHSSAKFDMREYGAAMETISYNGLPNFDLRPVDYPCGSIIGTVEIIGCCDASESPWFCGEYGFMLKRPIALAVPVKIRGALGFWSVPREIEQYVLANPSAPQPSVSAAEVPHG